MNSQYLKAYTWRGSRYLESTFGELQSQYCLHFMLQFPKASVITFCLAGSFLPHSQAVLSEKRSMVEIN